MRRTTLGLGTSILLMTTAATAAAQWTPLPGGEWGWATEISSRGGFACGRNIRVGTCTAAGNAVVLTNGASSLTIAFTGATHSVVIGSSELLSLGTFTTILSGPGSVVLPVPRNPNVAGMFSFTGMIHASQPGATRWVRYDMFLDDDEFLSVRGQSYVTMGLGRYPAGARGHQSLVFEHLNDIRIPTDGSTSQWVTRVSTIPEPATVLLTGGGLLALAGGHLRRRRATG